MKLAKPRFKLGHVSLERALSKLGLASRAQAKELIESGRVTLHGKLETNPARAVRPETAKIEIDGARVGKAAAKTIVLHKPKGVVTTRSDEKGRPTVFSLIEGVRENLHAIGRLDMATTGLLLLTNDTRLSSFLTDPKNAIPRVYVVTVRGRLTEAPSNVKIKKTSGKESTAIVELRQGKNREIRRMFEELGHEVTALKRISFGPIELGDLKPGEFRELTPAELTTLTSFF